MGDRGKERRRREKGESSVNLHGLENHCNLVLKVEEEEHQVPQTKRPRTKFHTLIHFLITQLASNRVQ